MTKIVSKNTGASPHVPNGSFSTPNWDKRACPLAHHGGSKSAAKSVHRDGNLIKMKVKGKFFESKFGGIC